MLVGMSTDIGAVLGPHQVVEDVQEPKRLHRLTGAMIGGTVPLSRAVTMESIPYTLTKVSRDKKKCPVCHQIFLTNHWMHCHMDIHKGTGYPCSKCHKSLVMKQTLRQHEKACIQGLRHVCRECQKSYASIQILKQHIKVAQGLGHPGEDEVFLCPHCNMPYSVTIWKDLWYERLVYCYKNNKDYFEVFELFEVFEFHGMCVIN